MNYREKLAGVISKRREVEDNITKLRDALYTSTAAEAEREAQRVKLQEQLASAVSSDADNAIDAILTGTASETVSEAARITERLSELERQDRDATTLETALRARIAEEQRRLNYEANPGNVIPDVVSNSDATVALVRRTRQAWVDAVSGSLAIKYLTEKRLLDHASLTERAGSPATHSVELLAHLTRNSEYKRVLPDRTFDGMPSWADSVRALERDASALLPGEKAASSKQGGLFGK